MKNEWIEAWRIFERSEVGPKTLFHGYHGSRTLPLDTELRAKQGIVTNPGKAGGNTFRAGWHVTLSEELGEKYLSKFTSGRDLVLCKVFVKHIRPKPRATSPVFLAKDMLVKEADWSNAYKGE